MLCMRCGLIIIIIIIIIIIRMMFMVLSLWQATARVRPGSFDERRPIAKWHVLWLTMYNWAS